MSDELFDIERLRKNWEPRQEERPPVVHRVLVPVGPALDPVRDANELLDRMETLALLRFPAHRATLGSFFREARELLEAHQRTENPPTENPPAEDPPTEEKTEPLVALRATLDRLEELLEVFTLGTELGVPSRRS